MNPLQSTIDYLFGGPKVGGAQEGRLRAWQALPEPDLDVAHEGARYIAVDTETTGLDLTRDRVIAIGAAAIDGARWSLSDCFEVVLRQDRASASDNILIHGIGGQAQLAGVEPRGGMLDFLEFAGKSPLVAFRADFDAVMLQRSTRSLLGVPLRGQWIDLAFLLPALFPGRDCRTLDDWLANFAIPAFERHHAIADAVAAAQLLQVALSTAERRGMRRPADLIAMQKAQRWLGKR